MPQQAAPAVDAAALLSAHGLATGDDVDYCPFGTHWVPARVEVVADGGGVLALRFAAGDMDVTHRLDLRAAGNARRLAPLGEWR
jgi:hypothetical protein